MISKRVYRSRNGIWHQIVWRDNKMYLKCNHAVGYKKRSEILFGYKVTCRNCLKKLEGS